MGSLFFSWAGTACQDKMLLSQQQETTHQHFCKPRSLCCRCGRNWSPNMSRGRGWLLSRQKNPKNEDQCKQQRCDSRYDDELELQLVDRVLEDLHLLPERIHRRIGNSGR